MNKIYKALSALLSYPDQALVEALPEISEIVEGSRQLTAKTRNGLQDLITELSSEPLLDRQEAYVHLFDRTISLSLHLFEHVHGESRDRGQAMVDLATIYGQKGLLTVDGELPDYLPLFLEFLSTLDPMEAQEHISHALHIVVALGERLEKKGTHYASLLNAIASMAHGKPDREGLEKLRSIPEHDPDDKEALDQAWEEAAVSFGPGPEGEGAGCPKAEAMMAEILGGSELAEEGRSDG